MPWNGSGIFNLVFNWPTDAANSIPISSTRMQAQEQDIATGLQNCLTLDGQTTPIADISWGTHKITNLATPTAAADAVTKAYVDSGAISVSTGTFLASGMTATFASATSFTVPGNQIAILIPGRRLKIVHNTGGTTSYATITSSTFGAVTTVVVLVDNNVALVTTITSLAIGLEQGNPDALPRRSFVSIDVPNTNLVTGSSAQMTFGSQLAYANPFVEVNLGAGTFTPARSGIYRWTFNGALFRNTATVTAPGFLAGNLDHTLGSITTGPGYSSWGPVETVDIAGFFDIGIHVSRVVPMTAGVSQLLWFGGGGGFNFTGGPPQIFGQLVIEALYYN